MGMGEGDGLAGAGLGYSYQVLALAGRRYGLVLYGGWDREFEAVELGEEPGSDIEAVKA